MALGTFAQYVRFIVIDLIFGYCGGGKRQNEFAEWHVAWLAE